MSDIPTPTPRETEILKVLWELGPSSVKTVHRFLVQKHEHDRDLAYNTVQTLLRIMDKKGLVDHELEGRTFIYAPRYSRDESAVSFVDRVFDGAADQMFLSLLRSERISPAELERMQALIAAARRGRRSHDSDAEAP